MPLERVFIDTNVLVSAIAFNGKERELLHLALDGKIRPVLSEYVLLEARRVISAKFPAYLPRLQWALALLDYELVAAMDPAVITWVAGLVRDPGDVDVLAAILTAGPDYAVTGDKDLLTDEIKAIAPTCRCADYLDLRARRD